MLGIQLIGILFGLLMLYITFVYSKKREFTSREWVVWSGLWLIFLILVILPQLLDPLLARLQLMRKMDFFISAGIMLSLVMIFYTYMVARSNQKALENMVREVAFINDQLKKQGLQK